MDKLCVIMVIRFHKKPIGLVMRLIWKLTQFAANIGQFHPRMTENYVNKKGGVWLDALKIWERTVQSGRKNRSFHAKGRRQSSFTDIER